MTFRMILLLSFLWTWQLAVAQNDDPVLFTVEGKPVHVSEFDYIYSKTNGDKADFSKASLEEYLDLYIKFKLKVQRARDMKLDTIPSLQQELEGYRKQLANSYLVDKEVTDRLVREAYDRSLQDVDISHIMIAVPPNALPKDTMSAYDKILAVQKFINQGQTFEEAAKRMSDDRNTKNNGGRIGYLSAMLPKGFYDLETAAYTLKEGTISEPIRTTAGYHLIKVNDKRPARGEIEAAHILVRIDPKKGQTDAVAKAKVDSIYQMLEAGSEFETLAREFSQDNKTARQAGYLGYFGINRYEKPFEDAAFGIDKDGGYSKPVRTKAGYHIIKRINKRAAEPYDIARRRLQPKVQADPRYQIAKRVMVDRIKKENNFNLKQENLEAWVNTLTPEYLTYKWKADQNPDKRPLFTLGKDGVFTVDDFEAYNQLAARDRLRAKRNSEPKTVAMDLFDKYVEESVIKYEESQLEEKYPEFKALMREYREGILLFEATKNLVWDRASQDTTGLKAFFANNRDNFQWKERAVLNIYTINKEAAKKAKKIRKCARKDSKEEVLEKFDDYKQYIAVQEKTIERGDDPLLKGLDWKKGAVSAMETNPQNQNLRFVKIHDILPAAPKELNDARGYIIADYQDYLEKEWIKELEAAYEVKVNESVLNSLVK